MEQKLIQRKVGILLAIGLIFMPFIFGWLTMRKGYSNIIRFISFGWMIFLMVMISTGSKNADITYNEQQKINWKYSQEQNENTQEISIMAVTNALYSDTIDRLEVIPVLYVVKPQNSDVRIAIRVNFARFYCPNASCSVTVSFDGTQSKYRVNASTDYKMLEIVNSKKFNRELIKANKLMVNVKYNNFDNPSNPYTKTVTFNTSNLKYPGMLEK